MTTEELKHTHGYKHGTRLEIYMDGIDTHYVAGHVSHEKAIDEIQSYLGLTARELNLYHTSHIYGHFLSPKEATRISGFDCDEDATSYFF